MPIVAVDDPDDPRLVELTSLTDAGARRSIEAEHGCFVAEGLLTLEAVVGTGHGVRSVLTTQAKLDRVLQIVPEDVVVHVAAPEVLEAVAGFSVHRGVVASVDRPPPVEPEELVARPGDGDLVVVEAVNDHENIGSIFRNAAAFGAAGVLLDGSAADPLYRRSVRVSLGHVLRVPWARVADTGDAMDLLAAEGWTTIALSPAGDTVVGSRPDRRRAWLVGAEGAGLSPRTLERADVRARIPMADGVDSLNVATSLAVALALSRPGS